MTLLSRGFVRSRDKLDRIVTYYESLLRLKPLDTSIKRQVTGKIWIYLHFYNI